MAVIRIAKIMYEHHALELSKDAYAPSLGQQIDKHIIETLAAGNLVSEVALMFEGEAEQVQLMDAYKSAIDDHRGYAVADDGAISNRKAKKDHY